MYYITVSNGLMKDGHRKKMGSAVWEFMWLIDKVTKIDDTGWGWVLGGKPINLDDIANDHQVIPNCVSKNLNKLQRVGYIKIIRTPYGLSIRVAKAKKRFTQKSDSHKRVDQSFQKSESSFQKSESNIRQGSRQGSKTITPDGVRTNLKTMKYTPINDNGEELTKIKGLRYPVTNRGEFNYRKELENMVKLSKPYRIVAHYFIAKKFKFENWEQYYPELTRNLKIAKSLKGYDSTEIQRVIDFCQKEYDVWTLETVSKRVADLINTQ